EAAIGEGESSSCATDPNPSACRTRFREAIGFRRVTLSPSGQQGLIVEFFLKDFCGSGGCSIYILKQEAEASGISYRYIYNNVLEELGGIDSFDFAKSVTNDFYDVTVNSGTFGMPSHIKYVWNGSKY